MIKFNVLSKYLGMAVLVLVILFLKFPFISVPGTYVSIRLENFVLLILGILTLVKVVPNLRTFLKDKVVISFLLFFGAGFVSLLAGAFVSHTVSLSIGTLHLLRRVEYAVPLFACLALLQKDARTNLDFYIKVLMIITAIVFLYGFGQRYFGLPIIDTQNEEYSKGIALRWTPGAHITSTFAGHYDMASYIVLILPIFTTLFFLTDKFKIKLAALAIVILPSLWLMSVSLSRISLVSWVIASSVPLILFKKYKAILAILVSAAVIIALSPSFLGRYEQLLKIVSTSSFKLNVLAAETASPAQTPPPVVEDRSTSIRLNIEWPRAISAFYKNPLLGSGYSSINLATDNDYLRALGETGILGFLAFGLIFIRIGKIYMQFFKNMSKFDMLEKSFITGVLGGAVGIFLTALVLDIFEASKFAIIYWFMVGYAMILIRNRLYE